jgi:MFS superfamily sulfate permease-like transporter
MAWLWANLFVLNLIFKMNTNNIFSYWRRDAVAGIITGMMAIPLTVGICLMSEYPVQTGLVTVVAACIISFITYLLVPGNHVGVPGVAAGLAPALAMGVHTFGMENMPFLIFLTACIQAVVWKFNWQKYILQLVPNYLVEGLLAGIGLKIALKFLPFTYLTFGDHQHANFILDSDHEIVMVLSLVSFGLFLLLFKRFQKTSPGLPYIATLVFGILCTLVFQLPLLEIPHVPIALRFPMPVVASLNTLLVLKMIGFALMLATIDVIEQVMSNAAIEKLDPLGRPCNTNNSLLTIWIANLASSFFGGMTNLDGLAKSTTNAVSGAVTKLSNLFTALVLSIVIFFPQLLSYLPEFSLGVIMIFSGWKMIAGLSHVIHQGKYAFMLSLFCGVLVFKLGIFEGLILALALHAFIAYFFLRNEGETFTGILQRLRGQFRDVETETSSVKDINTALAQDIPIVNKWMQAINKNSVEEVADLYAADAVLIPTLSDEIRDSNQKIKDYFVHFFQRENMQVELLTFSVKDFGNVRLNMGTYKFTFVQDHEPQTVTARFTFAIKESKIIEHHYSLVPN